jgi:hypothetical protein
MELSIVMPCLNEAETLPACVEMARRYLARSGVTDEIIIGDNKQHFGLLRADYTLGIVMPSVFSPAWGVQVVCSSLFLNILG